MARPEVAIDPATVPLLEWCAAPFDRRSRHAFAALRARLHAAERAIIARNKGRQLPYEAMLPSRIRVCGDRSDGKP